MKSLIIYSSKSGNTKKLADALTVTCCRGKKVCNSVDEKPATDGFDLVCVGFWFQSGKADPKTAELLQGLDSQAPLFLFATHGAAVESDHARNGMKQAEELAASAGSLEPSAARERSVQGCLQSSKAWIRLLRG